MVDSDTNNSVDAALTIMEITANALTKVTGQVINNTTDLVVGVTTVGGGLSAVDGFFSGIVTFSNNSWWKTLVEQ